MKYHNLPDILKRMRSKKVTAKSIEFSTEFITPKSKLKMNVLYERMEEEFQKAVINLKEDLIQYFMEQDKNAPEEVVRKVVDNFIEFECIQDYNVRSQDYSLRIVPRWKTADEIREDMEWL